MTTATVLAREAELTRLCHEFSYCMDYCRYEELVALFTPDARFDRILHVHHGHDEIRAALADRGTARVTRHISTNFHFEHPEETLSRGVVCNMSWFGTLPQDGTLPTRFDGPVMLMDFHDTYRLTPDGWRFAERIARPVLLDDASPMMAAGRNWNPLATG